MTLTSSATRFSDASHDLMSSLVTHAGRFPRKTVKLIYLFFDAPREVYEAHLAEIASPEANSILA